MIEASRWFSIPAALIFSLLITSVASADSGRITGSFGEYNCTEGTCNKTITVRCINTRENKIIGMATARVIAQCTRNQSAIYCVPVDYSNTCGPGFKLIRPLLPETLYVPENPIPDGTTSSLPDLIARKNHIDREVMELFGSLRKQLKGGSIDNLSRDKSQLTAIMRNGGKLITAADDYLETIVGFAPPSGTERNEFKTAINSCIDQSKAAAEAAIESAAETLKSTQLAASNALSKFSVAKLWERTKSKINDAMK
ncbi:MULTISPECIES: hypothetical protein [unclassified Chelatococcus]|uniref:hypothetical protein n=1 Tax=unclassified Chelatococcus TaxID=2638111 RepID=UPI001BCFD199|nr:MULTISPECIES: hypothetical protein [unclassified Chelatococcus]MBS7701586.1 hypothetical protein [Chelatococcus sp. YT9]MBX3557421.1 hypothetical protein [Chelatococcus sp.]